jgi:CyaY protein
MMDEPTFAVLADAVFKRVLNAVDQIDAEDAEADRAGDVLTILLRSKKKCILNTQRPTRQLWLACGTKAWHFDFANDRWTADKAPGDELYATLRGIVKEETSRDLAV